MTCTASSRFPLVGPLRACLLALVSLCFAAGCDDESCLVYDYGPPSLRIAVVDAATGEPVCSRASYIVRTNRGDAIAHEDVCEWWLPAWTREGDAGANATESELVVNVTRYLPQTVSVEIPRNNCGEIEQPPLLEVSVDPDPNPPEL